MNNASHSNLPDFVESEIDLEFALDAHSIAIFEWNARTGILTWAPGSEERLGQAAGTVKHHDDWSKITLPEDLPSVLQTLETAIASRAKQFSFSFRVRDANNNIRAYEGSSRCIWGEDGELDKTVSVAVDVTSNFEIRRALNASHDQFQSVLETSPTALIITDDRGVVLTFSRAAEHLFGHASADVVGRHFNMLTDQKVKLLLTATRRRPGQMHLLSALRADGKTAPVEVSVHEFGAHGPRLFTIFLRDVTERFEAERRLDALRDELAHTARLNTMGEVSAGIAHELNQPLTAMTNYLAAARNTIRGGEAEDGHIERLIDLASEQALRAGDIIRKMREFLSRGEIDQQPHPISDLIHEAVSLTSLGGQKPIFDLELSIPDSLPKVMVDKIQIQQVLVNLIKNAVEELSTNPTSCPKVWISAKQSSPRQICVSVEDNGPGLPASLLDHFYEPFTSTKPNGMGLGLSISRRIIEAHGGSLVGENRNSGGATFRFNLPISKKDEAT
ncbi:PAS domain-containing sensor histidine kinase [Erythrobacter aureus]|uniref:histidine kinase n=1 Tax=Erythrobacter aureus TaxID=2182384 RepID=A0A345YIG3_9SPHN|nr:PAS domain-containing sensor histidine kinase [Erythrobacter aureus]AXK43715.1 PAS domain-containing sensor histidine kinase [Erythrobacter aureus]